MTRLAYLDAMGVEAFVSRADLPGAAASRRRVIRAQPLPAAPVLADVPVEAGLARSPEMPAPPAEQPTRRAAEPAPSAQALDGPVFSVALTVVGDYAFLEELPRGFQLPEAYLPLLGAVARALGRGAEQPHLERFDWPINNSPTVGRDAEAARAGFEGFLMRCRSQYQPAAIVLLGEFDDGWFDPGLVADGTVVTTVSGCRMLREPELKPRAWSDLQALRERGA